MHEEILSPDQKILLPLLGTFSPTFGLVGGTAIALYLGHRRSIDFDLFTLNDFDNTMIKNTVRTNHEIQATLVDLVNQLMVVVDGVRVTFYTYPFPVEFSEQTGKNIKTPTLLTLAAMKCFALGGRAKWKDYVDLYFMFKTLTLKEVVTKAQELFRKEFNEKLLREQLSYFNDIDYSETIDYMPGSSVSDEVIKETLEEISLEK